METKMTYTAFEQNKKLVQGDLKTVILKVKERSINTKASILIFSDSTGKQMDFNLQGTVPEVLKRLEVFTTVKATPNYKGPGRPKLGVVSREISLLPKHWEWLATQSGGASVTLRRLVSQAMKASEGGEKKKQERTYSFISVMAGNFTHYEEAIRSLFKGNEKEFYSQISSWPEDIKTHAKELYQL